MKVLITDYTLYQKRYFIGYLLLIVLVTGLLSLAAFFVPGALRDGEIQSALTSSALSTQSIDPSTVVNLPYYLLQRLGFLAFGVSTLTIKLPSLIIGALLALGIFILIRTWFHRNVAVIVTAITATTTQFLFLAQDGTPAILFPFIVVWLLVAGTFVTRAKLFSTFWKVVCCVLMASALYVPYGIYLVIALIITSSLHPHIRYVIRRVSRSRLIIAILLGLVSITPLVYAIVLQPTVALTLLGIPATGIDLLKTVPEAGQNLFGFFSTSNGYILRPLYPLGIAILICLGMYKWLTVKHTARSYTVLILSAFLVPLVLIDPFQATALYPIGILMIGMGIAALISDWYKLFPRNPYARVSGLVIISIVVMGLVFTGSTRFINNYTYNPNVLSHYSSDLALLEKALDSTEKPVVLVTSRHELAFYNLVAHYNKDFTASTSSDHKNSYLIVTHDANSSQRVDSPLTGIVTNARASDADRFYIYKSPSK